MKGKRKGRIAALLVVMGIVLAVPVSNLYPANIVSAKSGLWNDPTTWSPSIVPGQNDNVTIMASHTVTFNVSQTVLSSFAIQAGASLVGANGADGAPGTAGGDAPAIDVRTSNGIVISGHITSGRGGNGGSVTVNASQGDSASAVAAAGGQGGDIILESSAGSILLSASSNLGTGNGGAGGDAIARGGAGASGTSGGKASARAAAGSASGTITLRALNGDLTIAYGAGALLNVGSGGSAGAGYAYGGGGGDAMDSPPGAGGSAESHGGIGGNSGTVEIDVLTFNGATTITDTAQFHQLFGGGQGASGGTAVSEAGDPGLDTGLGAARRLYGYGDCPNPYGLDGGGAVGRGGDGGSGIIWGGDGASVGVVAGKPGTGSGTGGEGMAYGGKGGDKTTLPVKIGGHPILALVPFFSPGDGGNAEGRGGDGGPLGGDGGITYAWGGDGGSWPALTPFGKGGTGGSGIGHGGNGMKGQDCCPTEVGEKGGDGGIAYARGGAGGYGAFGGNGGNASAYGGDGNDGGKGNPTGGAGGAHGEATALAGPKGSGLIQDGNGGNSIAIDGNPGEQGPVTIVHLTYCRAIAHEGFVEIEWATASEMGNAGFNIFRSKSTSSAREGLAEVNEAPIPARGDEMLGAEYSLRDYEASTDQAYYWLEDVDLKGSGTMHGPFSVESASSPGNGEEPLPKDFVLHQNFPNPFNPYTEIEYDLPRDCHVKLEIFNASGRKVITLVDAFRKAGRIVARWNGKDSRDIDLSSGVYFCRITASDFRQLRKMVLLR